MVIVRIAIERMAINPMVIDLTTVGLMADKRECLKLKTAGNCGMVSQITCALPVVFFLYGLRLIHLKLYYFFNRLRRLHGLCIEDRAGALVVGPLLVLDSGTDAYPLFCL